VVAAVRRATGIKKVGHAGTLDPLASGLILILVGREETKRAGELLGLSKSYETVVRIGEMRDTGDLEGKIVACATISSEITHETLVNGLKQALASMIGTMQLPVPAYSAIKQDGQRLYKKARKGQDFILPVRDMVVHGAELIEVTQVTLPVSGADNKERAGYEASVIFNVASGVYIRSLSEELGKRVGQIVGVTELPATTAALRRITIGEYDIKDAQTVEDIRNGADLIHREIDV